MRPPEERINPPEGAEIAYAEEQALFRRIGKAGKSHVLVGIGVDRKARFRWIGKPKDRPKGVLRFDFDGADFTHVGNRVTFEVLLSSFGLDSDPALNQLAPTIHFLDVGGIPVADARGLEVVLKGARDSARSDDELVLAAARLFDHVYSAYQSTEVVPPIAISSRRKERRA